MQFQRFIYFRGERMNKYQEALRVKKIHIEQPLKILVLQKFYKKPSTKQKIMMIDDTE